MIKKSRTTKTKYFKKVVYFMITFLVIYACRKNQIRIDQNAIHFTSAIVEENQSKPIDTKWEKGDEIGVFMIESGMPLSMNSIVNATNNRMFFINGSIFQSTEDLFLPEKSVDFIAYYPFKIITDYQYAVDITDQFIQDK